MFNNFFITLLDTALNIEPINNVKVNASRLVASRTKNEIETNDDADFPTRVTSWSNFGSIVFVLGACGIVYSGSLDWSATPEATRCRSNLRTAMM